MVASSSDHTRLTELQAELVTLAAKREELETEWLQLSETVEG